MKRPRIALWIKSNGAEVFPSLDAYRTHWWCPGGLWRWAVRRVERWRIQELGERMFDQMWEAWP